ncbi:MAG TPA: hypothetical protein PKJ93_10355, partial [Methanoculleus sp.]|nr:hypothetical protein [Methanoculleus sp.]
MEEYARRGKRVILSGGAARFGPPAAITAMAYRTEVAGKGPGANAYWIDARALSLSAGGAGVAGGNAGKVEATRSKMVGVWETGEGEQVPP